MVNTGAPSCKSGQMMQVMQTTVSITFKPSRLYMRNMHRYEKVNTTYTYIEIIYTFLGAEEYFFTGEDVVFEI